MTRLARGWDRTVCLLLGLVGLLVGLAGLAWSSRTQSWMPQLGFVQNWPESLTSRPLTQAISAPWWPWLMLVLGVLLILLGARWVLSHLPRRGVGYLRLGDDEGGRMLVNARSMVDAAALAYNAEPGVDTAVGTLTDVDGRLVAQISATVQSDADLADLAARADELSRQLRAVSGRDDLHMSVLFRTTPQTATRVQ